jgi:hypothetical protein
MSDFLRILEFRLHFEKASIEIILKEFSLENFKNIITTCEVLDIDLSQRILKNFIWVTFLLRQLATSTPLPDNGSYRVEG